MQPEFHAVLLDASLNMTTTLRSIVGVRFRNSPMLIQQNELLPANDSSMTDEKINRTWFTDEKVFTVQTPTNTQNDLVYANVKFKHDVTPDRLLKGRKHFSQSVMVSVAVSKLGKTAPFFVTPKAKVNSVYYCDEVLAKGLLPDIRRLSVGDDYVFQQDGAPAHRSRHTVAYLNANVPEFIEPEN